MKLRNFHTLVIVIVVATTVLAAAMTARAESIVGEEVDKFGGWFRSRGAIPTVVALRQHFETVRRAELDRLLKLSALPPDVRGRVDEITRLIVEKLLLTPTEQLKSVGDAETVGAYTEALTRLFRLRSQQLLANDSDPERPKVVEGPFNRSSDRSSNSGR